LGHVAERVAQGISKPTDNRKTDKLDRILAELDDEDRAIVLSWLHSRDVTQDEAEDRLADCEIFVSASTVRRWRKRNAPAWGA
jgi:transposase